MDQQTFSGLLEKYLNETISDAELNLLLDSLEDEDMRQQWEAAVTTLLNRKGLHGLSDKARMRAVRRAILAETGETIPHTSIYKKLLPYAAAAAILLLLGTWLWPLLRKAAPMPAKTVAAQPLQVIPGGNKAILTLADGSRITLDTAGNGAIASQGNVQVIKLNSGQLAYNAGRTTGNREVAYNTLSTPRGGQFRIILPDGSEVWLNAASSLRFPTVFSGTEREVELNGEAYFEVAKNPSMPFRVKVKDMAVQVLGTHFNVTAYHDEQRIRTTLLEGSVNVQHGANAVRLQPGQRANLNAGGTLTVEDKVDMNEAVAWKNGYFHFNHEPLDGVMRQIGRWYDAEVIYEGSLPQREFGGKIARSSSVEDVLKILELSNVHYRIDGKKIIITP